MDLKKTLTRGALRLLEDPRVRKIAQDPRVWRGLATAWSVRGELVRGLDEQTRRLAKELGLATPAEIRELRGTIEELRSELERSRARGHADTNKPTRKPASRAKRPSVAKSDPETAEVATPITDRSPRRRARRSRDRGSEPPPA